MTEFAEKYMNHERLKYYRDLKNSLDAAYEDGMEQGIEKGIEKGIAKEKKNSELEKKAIVINLIKLGLTIDVITKATSLSEEEIEKIKEEL